MVERVSLPVAVLVLAVASAVIAWQRPAHVRNGDRFLQIYITNIDIDHAVYGEVDRSTMKTIRSGGEVRRTFILDGQRRSVRVFAHSDADLAKWESWARGVLVRGARARAEASAFGIELDDNKPVFVIGELWKKTWTKYEGLRCVDEVVGGRCRD